MIRLTRINLEALNSRYAGDKHPPPLFIQEYEELTNKLYDFQAEEQRMVDQLELTLSGVDTVDSPNYNHLVDTNQTDMNNDDDEASDSDTALNSSTGGTGHSSSHHVRRAVGVVRAYLPNQQRTSVPATHGQTVRDALFKAMRRRRLNSDTCTVYRCKPIKLRIDWETDVSTLEGEEILVESAATFPISTSISHNFVRKTFFTLAFCECCHRILFHGFRCQTCGFRFHQRCATHVPALCQPLRVESNYYGHLLALNDPLYFNNIFFPPDKTNTGNSGDGGSSGYGSGGSGSSRGKSGSKHSPNSSTSSSNNNATSITQSTSNSGPLGSGRERSTSAPNVCFNLVNSNSSTMSKHHQHQQQQQQLLLQQQQQHHHHGSGQKGGVQSVSGSPTNKAANSAGNGAWRPRARSADESSTNKIQPPGSKSKVAGRESIEDWEIPCDEILTGCRIGSGSFGTVYRGAWHGPVALKKLNVTNPTPSQLQAFKNEVAVLRKTRHVSQLSLI